VPLGRYKRNRKTLTFGGGVDEASGRVSKPGPVSKPGYVSKVGKFSDAGLRVEDGTDVVDVVQTDEVRSV
jgi:hypothetical protein